MTRGIYVLGGEPATVKSAVALGVQRLLAGQVSRLGVFRPVVAGDGDADPLLEVLQADGAAVSWGSATRTFAPTSAGRSPRSSRAITRWRRRATRCGRSAPTSPAWGRRASSRSTRG